MKNLNLNPAYTNNLNNTGSTANVKDFLSQKVNNVASISPFILLLIPVFVAMIVSFTISNPEQNVTELKTDTKATTSVVNIASKLF